MSQTPVPPSIGHGFAPAPVPPAPARPRTSAAAVIALVAAALALVPVAVVMGIVALFRIRNQELRGKRAAVVALSLSAGWIALAMIGIIGTAAYVGSTQGPVSAFAVGSCYDYVSGHDARAGIHTVDCGGAHDGQIVGRVTFAGSFPGQEQATEESVVGCTTDAARRIVDVGQLDEVARVSTYVPTQTAWDNGVKSATCVLVDSDGTPRFDDALDRTDMTPARSTVLALTNESALLRLKLRYLTGTVWRDAVVLERRLAVVDRAEAAALTRLANTPPEGGRADLPTLLRRLATEDLREVPVAENAAARTTDPDSWRKLAVAGKITSSHALTAYQDLRLAL
ncbi:septum formation family protein [Streptacidiphilus rugosus]|uniref:septum formation family protein n=1 Tax=Streptacidiphilus rugosus TaxID=405783 RepID=UPI0012FBA184|nr:septum formation family protein [Streptacidiphilus rugosus]